MVPNIISIAPEAISDTLSILFPKNFPTLIDAIENIKVMAPIMIEDKNQFSYNNPKLTPAAIASILVAILKRTRESFFLGFSFEYKASIIGLDIILIPKNIKIEEDKYIL